MIVTAAAVLCVAWTLAIIGVGMTDVYIGVHPTLAQREAAGAFRERFVFAYLVLMVATIGTGFWLARLKR